MQAFTIWGGRGYARFTDPSPKVFTPYYFVIFVGVEGGGGG